MTRLAGKVALVTGAGRAGGLGQAIARRLAAEGASLVLHDRGAVAGEIAPAHGVGTLSDLEITAAAIRAATGARIETVTGDLMQESAIAAMVGVAATAFGRLDILINNAGIGYLFGPLAQADAAHLDAVLGVNLRAPMLAIKHAVPLMQATGGGRIVNIASQAGKSGFAMATAYTASKHGLIGLTRAAALELAPLGITVNAVCPNHVTTGLGAWQNDFMASARGESLEDYLDGMRKRIPLGRPGLPEDTAGAVAFLCSDDAAYITAEALNVSGGEEYH